MLRPGHFRSPWTLSRESTTMDEFPSYLRSASPTLTMRVNPSAAPQVPRWKPASRSRRSWRRATSNPDSKPFKALSVEGVTEARPLDSGCPGDSVNYPGAWGLPLPLPQTARCALDANPPPGPSLTSKVQFVPGSGYRRGQGHRDDRLASPRDGASPIWSSGRGLAGRRPTPGSASPARKMHAKPESCAQ
jgi:hypothetical protein